MRLVLISDTHGWHHKLELPAGDVLIHAGDFSEKTGTVPEAEDFAAWMIEQPHKHKILVCGNHDGQMYSYPELHHLFVGTRVLHDEALEIDGVLFYGTPWLPAFGNTQSFMLERDSADLEHMRWAIPDRVDVLVTHGPPYGVLDGDEKLARHGCKLLAERVLEVRPTLHVFGHIHEGYGLCDDHYGTGVFFVNAALCSRSPKRLVNAPIVLDLYRGGVTQVTSQHPVPQSRL